METKQKKEKFSSRSKVSELLIIRGGKDEETYGLGDPCVPPQVSCFPEENPKSTASISQVDARANKQLSNK